MSEMAERVARAIHAELFDPGGTCFTSEFGDGRNVTIDGVFDLQDLARAAISAMREPTAKMVEAGAELIRPGYESTTPPVRDAFSAMIDEALK